VSLAGIILAAGESTRMGSPKPLLKSGDKTFLEIAVETLKDQVSPLLAVLGHEAEAIQTAHPSLSVTFITNPAYREGQITSLQFGIRHLIDQKTSCEGVVVSLIDHPGVSQGLVRQLTRIFKQTEPPIALPVYQGHRGHPVIFSANLFQEILALNLSQGVNEIIHKYVGKVCELSTTESSILKNINRPEDL